MPNAPTALLTVSELAARSGVAPSALRYYERLGLISAERTGGNQRRYARSVLRRVAVIRAARAMGVPLAQVVQALQALPAGREPRLADWERLSRRWHAELSDRILVLQRLRDRLGSCIGCGCLSLQRCKLFNPDDRAGEAGDGPQYLLGKVCKTSGQSDW
jgi:MerR family transcriptional regulator, redox-sensitive transcriptional activator SoxR